MSNNTMIEFYRDGRFTVLQDQQPNLGQFILCRKQHFTGGVNDTEAKFELLPQGKAKVQFQFIRRRKLELEGTKVLVYEKQE
jgi:hypothetical protein